MTMQRTIGPIKIVFTIVLGYVFVSMFGPTAVTVTAQQDAAQGSDIHVCVDSAGAMHMISLAATCPNDQQSRILKRAGDSDVDKPKAKRNGNTSQIDKTILDKLNRRLKDLEEMRCDLPGKSRVIAPFELKDRNGNRIFYVDQNAVGLFNASGQAVAKFSANSEGGLFVAQGVDNIAFFGISDTVAGFGVREGNQLRVELGRNPEYGNYRLNVRSASGQPIAGIGMGSDNLGLALIRDQSGNTKARIGLSQNGTGLIEVLAGKTIAQLTEGDQHRGGKLWIGNAGGVGMVEAGDAGGYGVVKAGPMGFEYIPTPGLGLPGSVIAGKP